MSGVTPYRSWAPPAASRNPVITSSKTTRAPAARVAETSTLEIAGARLEHTARPGHDLTDHRGEPVPGRVDRLGEHCGVVPGHDPHRLHGARRNAGGVGPRGAGSGGWPDAGREMVGPAVVVPLELDHELAAGRRTREPDGRLGRLGARVREAQLLDPGHELGDELGSLAREAVWEGGVPADAGDGLLDGLADEVGRVPEEVDAVAHAVVDVGVAVEIADRRSLRLLDHELLAGAQARVARLAAGNVAGDLGEGCA